MQFLANNADYNSICLLVLVHSIGWVLSYNHSNTWRKLSGLIPRVSVSNKDVAEVDRINVHNTQNVINCTIAIFLMQYVNQSSHLRESEWLQLRIFKLSSSYAPKHLISHHGGRSLLLLAVNRKEVIYVPLICDLEACTVWWASSVTPWINQD